MAYPAELFLDHPRKEPNLFQCEKDGNSFLLFGTYHVMPLSVIPDEYLEVMKQADRLILESVHKRRTEESLIKAGLLHAAEQDKAVYEKLTPMAREILLNALKLFAPRHELPPIPLTRVVLERAIWFARFCINYGGMDSCLENLGFPLVLGLETDESIDFDAITIDELNNSLEGSFGCLKNPPEYPEEVLVPMDQYLAGNTLYNPGYCNSQEQDDFVWSRNNTWMPEILRQHALGGKALIAVGHTHLVGTTGLLCLLQQAGFKITQYVASEKIFEPFIPELLFKPNAENYAIAKRIEIVMDEIIEKRHSSVVNGDVPEGDGIVKLIQDKTDKNKPDKTAKASISYPALSDVQYSVYSLMMQYWEPVVPVVFSKIYPNRKNESESELELEQSKENTVEKSKVADLSA